MSEAAIAALMPQIDPRALYTPEEAAPLIRCCAETVRSYCRKGRLRAVLRGWGRVSYLVPGVELLRMHRLSEGDHPVEGVPTPAAVKAARRAVDAKLAKMFAGKKK